MKKIYLAALTLAMTACVSNDDLNPVDNYGYIDVNVSNDPIMQTRGTQVVSDLNNWVVLASDNSVETEDIRLTTASTKVKAGKYTVSAKSHASAAEALTDNHDWGAAYYEGTSGEVTVTAGQPADAVVNCGTAKNARLKVQFSLIGNFTGYSLTAERGLVFNSENAASALAYYAATEEVDYTLKYKYNNGAEKTITGKITMKGAATENTISIASNDNGTISVTVNYDDTFGTGNSQNLEFDAATGEEVKK